MTKPPLVANAEWPSPRPLAGAGGWTTTIPSTSGWCCPTPRWARCWPSINASIVLISLPAIFRGIGLNPLAPGNVSYLLWMLMGYLVVTAVLVVFFGRLGDMFGRVRIYNLGFVGLHRRRDRAVLRPVPPRRRRAVADRLAGGAGRRRRDADGVVGGDPDRRVPVEPARHGARREHGGRRRRLVPRSADRRRALRVALAGDLLGRRADRHARHDLEHAVAEGTRCPHAGSAGLGGHADVRCRADGAADRDHLRHPAVRRLPDRLDQPVGARRHRASACCCWWRSASSSCGWPNRWSTSGCSARRRSAWATSPA